MTPQQIKSAFDEGKNITELLRQFEGSAVNTDEIIEIAYDLQSGSYIAGIADPAYRRHKERYGAAMAELITRGGHPGSLLEAGVGEATTLSYVIESLPRPIEHIHGIDVSWSRIHCAREWLRSREIAGVTLAVASLFRLPYADDSFDVVYTSHAIEPNGGRETEILKELHRVASRYLVLLEPGYELAGPEAKSRMERLGYCKGLAETAEALGFRVLEHRAFSETLVPLNPTALTIIEKSSDAPTARPRYQCPKFGGELLHRSGAYFSRESMHAYPVIDGIPCFRTRDGIVASKFSELLD